MPAVAGWFFDRHTPKSYFYSLNGYNDSNISKYPVRSKILSCYGSQYGSS